jgi:hypothetical protein
VLAVDRWRCAQRQTGVTLCPYCNAYGRATCNYTGQTGGIPVSKAKAAGPKVGSLVEGARCKRCRGEALRVSKVLLDKVELFCKLCGKEQSVPTEVKR